MDDSTSSNNDGETASEINGVEETGAYKFTFLIVHNQGIFLKRTLAIYTHFFIRNKGRC